jgi:excisionase family DNA binding protein
MKYLTTKEAARRLHYTGDTQIRKIIQRGKLKAEKFGGVWVIAEEELQAFKRSGFIKGVPFCSNSPATSRVPGVFAEP